MESSFLSLHGFSYRQLHDPEFLPRLTDAFHEDAKLADPELFRRFESYRTTGGRNLPEPEISEILVQMAGRLSIFLAGLFPISGETETARRKARQEEVIFRCKKEFFVRRVLKKFPPERAASFDLNGTGRKAVTILRAIPNIPHDDPELEAASGILALLEHEAYAKVGLPPASCNVLAALAARLRETDEVRDIVPASTGELSLRLFLTAMITVFEHWLAVLSACGAARWAMFQTPRPVDSAHLVDVESPDPGTPEFRVGPADRYRRRDGFDLTDCRFDARSVMSEVDYCILCHERDKDSCSKGLRAEGGYRKNPLGIVLKGCPLGQRISESHALKGQGDTLGALALIMIDNPMVPGTGHRICNDCMKSCIFQKQDPVNIPQVETRILTDVLALPWGFEIYSLLTRWNPLNIRRPHALPYNGLKVLIVGLGPAGYTLAHYFLNEGFGVVAIDGLKIEPLPPELTGSGSGEWTPVRDFQALVKPLSERPLAGFGGVSEYGITVRWDKNFLTVLHLNLMRRERFQLFDGVRFGGTLSAEDAWTYGFDHICIAAGAGKPTFVRMKNNLIRGIRKASDFLMALQLTGAGKKDSMANLQIRLPAVVIGGGLTAIDAATELMAYYPVQVEKVSHRYDRLVEHYGRDSLEAMFDPEESAILKEFLDHAGACARERQRAAEAGELPNFIPLVREWGGVRICYRKAMLDSPAYRVNHEEIIKGLEEGIAFVERMNPLEALPDQFGAVREMRFEETELREGSWRGTGRTHCVPARTVIIAAGTAPNIMYEREHPGTFALDDEDEFFAANTLVDGVPVPGNGSHASFFTSYAREGRFVTFYGDNHPEYAGNVVKAMASAKRGYPVVVEALAPRRKEALLRLEKGAGAEWLSFTRRLAGDLVGRVVRVNRLTRTITEVIVRAPKAAREFHPGQFYRLQNYEADSPRLGNTLVTMEGVALTGAWVERNEGLIGMIVLEVGASSRICSMLKPGQRVVVMGPTGTPTLIKEHETVIVLGGGLGNAVLFSIGRAIREKGGRVLYFAGYRREEDFFKQEWIEGAADVVVYSVDAGEPIPARRPQDRSCTGTIIQAMLAYAQGELGPVTIPLDEAARIIAIGSDRMMAAVTKARHEVLKPFLRAEHTGIVSVNSPMQCMMKAICAQCLQRHVDPVTGKEEFVFSCVNQDQVMDEVDFANLNARLRANSVMEKITNRWLDLLLEGSSPSQKVGSPLCV